jgi:hypothetical protein
VTKLSFFFTTLVAAIPAAFLAYLCVMAFLMHADTLPGMLMVVAGLTLLLSVGIVALPVAVLLRKGSPKLAEEEKPASEAAEEEEGGWDANEGTTGEAADEGEPFGESDADEFAGFDEAEDK